MHTRLSIFLCHTLTYQLLVTHFRSSITLPLKNWRGFYRYILQKESKVPIVMRKTRTEIICCSTTHADNRHSSYSNRVVRVYVYRTRTPNRLLCFSFSTFCFPFRYTSRARIVHICRTIRME